MTHALRVSRPTWIAVAVVCAAVVTLLHATEPVGYEEPLLPRFHFTPATARTAFRVRRKNFSRSSVRSAAAHQQGRSRSAAPGVIRLLRVLVT